MTDHYFRRWLGCVSCGASIWTDNPRPRLPICSACRPEREASRAERRARRAQRRHEKNWSRV